MTLVAVPGGVYFPDAMGDITPSIVRHVLDASGEKCAAVFAVPKDGTIDTVIFRTKTVAQDTNGMRVSLQTVDVATGLPDGTADQYRVQSVSSNVWYETGLITSDGTDGGAKRTVAAGELLSVVIEFDSFAASDDVDIAGITVSSSASHDGGTQYGAFHNGTSWAVNSTLIGIGLKYSTGEYITLSPGLTTLTVSAIEAFNDSDTPDEIGLIFELPFPAQCTGAWATVDIDNALDFILYDSASSILGSQSLDPDVRQGTTIAPSLARWDPVSLAKNTTYRLVVKPTTSSDVRLAMYEMYAQDSTSGGAVMHRTERTNAGSWSETTTMRPIMGLLLTGFDDAAGGGGGGGVRNPLGGSVG